MPSKRNAHRYCTCVGTLVVVGMLSIGRSAEGEVRLAVAPLGVAVEAAPTVEGLSLVTMGRDRLEQASMQRKTVTLEGMTFGELHSATIHLEPMRVLSPGAKLVVGHPGGADEPLDYDLSAVHTFRGKVAGIEDSNVVVVSTPRGLSGFVEIPNAGKNYKLRSLDRSGQALPADQVAVYETAPQSSAPADVPQCGRQAGESVVAGCCGEPSPLALFNKRVKTVEIAIETDYDLFQTFGTLAATADHVVEIMAQSLQSTIPRPPARRDRRRRDGQPLQKSGGGSLEDRDKAATRGLRSQRGHQRLGHRGGGRQFQGIRLPLLRTLPLPLYGDMQ